MRKNIYFAGHMEIDFENKEISNLTKDYRCCIVDSDKILMPFDPIPLNDKYSYGWPSFYYADEDGNPSLSSNLILEKEFAIIPTIDIMVAFLQEEITAGTIGEIMYAAFNKKTILLDKYSKKATKTFKSKKFVNAKKLYVRVMAYKKNGKKKVAISKWSKAKKVKIKRNNI